MTTTTTTVGYGDFNAAKIPDYQSADNMAMISFLQFMAIFSFTLIRDKIFAVQFDVSLQEQLKKGGDEAQ